MTQIWKEDRVIPVTLIEAGPCEITQIKNTKKDGYESVQIGFENKKTNKPMKAKPFRYLREFEIGEKELKLGDKIDVSIFQEGDKIKIRGISKGKGFQGGVKRHGFSGRNATHGVKHEERTIGSVGCAFPQRVMKGRRMPGRMGSDTTTVKNLEIEKIDKENNLLAVRGAVPGKRGTLLEIRKEK